VTLHRHVRTIFTVLKVNICSLVFAVRCFLLVTEFRYCTCTSQ